jgi:serine/threonine protein kinase
VIAAVKPWPDDGNADVRNPADQLDRLWAGGERPEVSGFLAAYESLPPDLLTDVLRVDMQRRWSFDRRTAGYYFDSYPQVASDADCALDLVFHEFLLSQRDQADLNIDAFIARYSALARPLRAQIELHQALGPTSNEDFTTPADSTTLDAPRSAFDDPASWKLPRQFGRYRLEQVLGHGGMGTIFSAMDEQLNRRVAVKMPRFHGTDQTAAIDRFYREARIAANLSHPNLCPIHDLGQWQGHHYFTMPQLSGETLAARIRRLGCLDPITSAELIRTIARALAVAHRAGVVHRDVKPSNVMINELSDPIVMDFGLARSESSIDPRLTASGAILGTPNYLAPELIGGPATPAAGRLGDIYSLGVMLYEMLAGQPPYQGTCADVLRRSLTQDPPSLLSIRTDVDRQLAEICERAMARDPQRRFPSMDELAAALDGWLEPSAATDNPRQTVRPRRLLSRRSWTSLAVAGICLLLAFVGSRLAARIGSWTGDIAAAWQAGTTWNGMFRFRPPIQDYVGDVQIIVTHRAGERFFGTYATENGAYLWEIAGSIARHEGAESIEWHVVRAVRELEPRPMMQGAHATGTLHGNQSQQVLTIPGPSDSRGESIADLTIRLEGA